MFSQYILQFFIIHEVGKLWYYITLDVGKLVISIICKKNSINKYLPEFQSFLNLYFNNNYCYTDNYITYYVLME